MRGGFAVELTVVVSTYERPEALDAVLRALSEQSDDCFEVVVADDGSGPATAAVVQRWRAAFGNRLRHLWQPDDGFRLARVRNSAALTARPGYLVFMDGDCLPRRGFVRAMRRAARPRWFVAGRRLELSRALTEDVLANRLPVHRWSLVRWLRSPADAAPLQALIPRDRRRVGARGVPEYEPPDRAYGYLLGVLSAHFQGVNGYDTRFVGWGEEDVDLAVRLRRLGLHCGHAGPQATLIHLWHPSVKERERPNWWLLQETERSDRIEAVEGLRELAAEFGTQATAKRAGASSSASEPVKQ